MDPEQKKGWLSGTFAYLLWGALPLFWTHLSHIPAPVVVAHRILWAALALLLFFGVARPGPERWRVMVRESRRYSISALFLALNWGLYVWSVSNGLVLAASLGYFLAPLFYVLGGVTLGERLSAPKRVATLFGAAAVVPLFAGSDLATMVVAVGLAGSFVVYALFRKKGALGAFEGLFVESLALVPLAGLVVVGTEGLAGLGGKYDGVTLALLMAAGPVTLAPLALFAVAVKRLPLSSVGFLQYISPILQFALAVAWFGESVAMNRLVSFGLVWTGILVLVTSEGWSRRRRGAPQAVDPS